jgi:hypothetical protein
VRTAELKNEPGLERCWGCKLCEEVLQCFFCGLAVLALKSFCVQEVEDENQQFELR